FADHPGEWRRLRADPALLRPAIEEVLRFESPGQSFFRTTTCPVDVGGVAIPAGQKVLLFLGAANRDPRHWSAPDRFDITRHPRGHLAFGAGIHACVGHMVARMEAEAILGALLRHVAEIEPAGPPQPRLSNSMRALAHLPLAVRPAMPS
ncbi:MAG TPA: cytochrome P450, partial [Acetobacteraceae bacterium]|nr:cytochrome P450 [Acetobacteraceae bacterium]